MKILRYILPTLICSGGLLASVVIAAPTPRAKPSVSYTQALNCQNGHQTHYFDITYFNSEIPTGSTVSVLLGYEHDLNCCRRWWYDPNVILMTQWEQFGWMLRISHEVACGSGPSTLAGIDFYVQIQSPSGEILREPSLTQQGTQGYYRSQVPDMGACSKSIDTETEKSCAVEVQWVNGL